MAEIIVAGAVHFIQNITHTLYTRLNTYICLVMEVIPTEIIALYQCSMYMYNQQSLILACNIYPKVKQCAVHCILERIDRGFCLRQT